MQFRNHCWKCGWTLLASDYSREKVCFKCGEDTRVCRACQFYDESAYNQCHESAAERVLDKEKSNFCDYFRPGVQTKEDIAALQESLKSNAEALFKKKI